MRLLSLANDTQQQRTEQNVVTKIQINVNDSTIRTTPLESRTFRGNMRPNGAIRLIALESCLTGKLGMEIKGGNQGFLEKSISSLSQAIVQLNSNVMKINKDNESTRKLLIGMENSPSNSPGIKKKVETMQESSLKANEEIEEILSIF
ncbi:unnamed protein product [Brachionus calyciflorus]|uniref:Uncharacterized protein n=1 Tax=Brachionus calyciflorus TaxID=104777 RepID=A0A813VC13_9BILA|nr:unnamed protein product [Brachionus calyciflorus]